VRDVRSASVIALAALARRRLEGFARHGTTTLEAKSGYALDEQGERKTLGLLRDLDAHPLDIVPTYLGAHMTPPEYDARPDEYIDWMIGHMLPMVREQRLAEFVDAYIDRGGFTLDQARRYFTAARGLGFGLRVHAEQFTRTGAARLACELGAASADHLEQATLEDADALAQSETVATLLPGSVFHLSLPRYAPGRLLIDRGAAVSAGYGFQSRNQSDMQHADGDCLGLPDDDDEHREAITAATVNAAAALQRSQRVGLIEPGNDADLIILNAEDHRELAYWFGVQSGGADDEARRVVYEDNRKRIEEEEIPARDASHD